MTEALSKTEQAYQALRGDILSARLLPDQPLRARTIGDESGLGWTPVREALSRLEAERLVISETNRGFRVAPVSREELEDLEQARLAVEQSLLSESIRQGSDQWEAGLLASYHLLNKATLPLDTDDKDQHSRWINLHDSFHQALLSAASSQWLHRFQQQLHEQLQRHHRAMLVGPAVAAAAGRHTGRSDLSDLMRQALGPDHHAALMTAALDRDQPSALALLEEHVTFTRAVYHALFSDETFS
ncbi:GntR family transcriptional regulator [Coralliovum pocilloporae]|uniref:GntR family transcriptional regulator n=1 Tax=Coralliovum pocilloporae TaxID=3066369 RepID=UPI0033076428